MRSYHALFWHSGLDFAADHLSQSGAVLWGSKPPLGLRSTRLSGWDPRCLASSLIHIHEQSVSLPRGTLGNRYTGEFFQLLPHMLILSSDKYQMFCESVPLCNLLKHCRISYFWLLLYITAHNTLA